MDDVIQLDAFPKVSVIIPFYNNIQWLRDALDSVLNQDYLNYEVIVVNDGSEEDTSSLLSMYKGRVTFYSKENGGAASARNFGIAHATGEYVAFLDSDDLWKPNKLSVQISNMIKFGAVWSYTDYETFGEEVKTEYKKMSKKSMGMSESVSPYIGTPTVVIKRQFLTDNDLRFCEELRYGEDSVLWERSISISPVLYIPQSLASVRMRGNNAGMRAAVQLIARVYVYDKCVEYIPNYKHKHTIVYNLAISLCRLCRRFIDANQADSKSVEFKARALFVIPYLLFKIDRLIRNK